MQRVAAALSDYAHQVHTRGIPMLVIVEALDTHTHTHTNIHTHTHTHTHTHLHTHAHTTPYTHTRCVYLELLPWWVVGIIMVRDTFLLTGSYVLAHRVAAKRGVSIFSSTIQSENPLEIKVGREREGGCVIGC